MVASWAVKGGLNLKLNAINKRDKPKGFPKGIDPHARAPNIRLVGDCLGVHPLIFNFKI